MTDLPKISDEEMDELVKLFRAGHAAAPVPSTPDERVRAGLAVALVASGYRREADVLREYADRWHYVDHTRWPMSTFGAAPTPYCACGKTWPEGGCTERRNLLADGATALEPVIVPCECPDPRCPNRVAVQLVGDEDRAEATALEPSLPLPVADGREIEQGQERSDG